MRLRFQTHKVPHDTLPSGTVIYSKVADRDISVECHCEGTDQLKRSLLDSDRSRRVQTRVRNSAPQG